jgi:D-serine deaminase-like pyridoxal phosphate-dependent protein
MRLEDLPTPTLILDRERFEANCRRMLARCEALGVGLRPHMKTMKSIDAARSAIDPGHGGITVSTLYEAEYFGGHGIGDILYAVCITPDKFERAAAIAARIEQLGFFVDNADVAAQLGGFADANGASFDVWIEIDSGEHRTGVEPEGDELIQIAEALGGSTAARLRGVATHAGHSYGCRSLDEIRVVAEQERLAVVTAAERLRAAGFDCPGTSIGSTPTAMFAKSAEGITEIRAGVYQAGDLVQERLGTCRREDIALSVLATVISHHRGQRKIVVDAGGLALSKDTGVSGEGGPASYGVLDIGHLGAPSISRVYQEHGQIHGADEALFEALPIGSKVRILPNHACMTAAMHDSYHLVDEQGTLSGTWQRTNGWS